MSELSVVICTNDPHPDYLGRVLLSLRQQELSLDRWQLVIVDNASFKPISNSYDLSWHPNARHLREEELGLSFARRKGVSEADGELIVFVDDDNILAPDYLTEAMEIMRDKNVGAVGGAGIPEFEDGCSPPAHFYNFVTWLACGAQLGGHRNVSKEVIDLTDQHHVSLFGAGLVLRREDILDLLTLPQFPSISGRSGAMPSSGEDYEICHLIALKGKRLLYSSRLNFKHIIPPARYEPTYLERLASNTDHRRRIRCYIAARQVCARGRSVASLFKSALKHLVLRQSHLAAFELALFFNVESLAQSQDRMAFRNIRALRVVRRSSHRAPVSKSSDEIGPCKVSQS